MSALPVARCARGARARGLCASCQAITLRSSPRVPCVEFALSSATRPRGVARPDCAREQTTQRAAFC
eukprot:7961256-Lingulodinium_polyedra.AAC.1